MSECACEAVLLGRESVQGTANADSLVSLIRLLTRRGSINRKYNLRCTRDGIEIRTVRRHDDEGFESDDDATSHASSDSNSSSCCFVEDRMVEYSGPQSLPVHELSGMSSVATDSANSSGASDNEDADNLLTSTPQQQPSVIARVPKPKRSPVDECVLRQFYAFNDVAFCHTDAAFPKVLVLVIKKKAKVKEDEVDSTAGLEAVIFQCKSVESLKEVCSSYKEFSRRLKMELQFRYPHRRKHSTTDNTSSTLYRNTVNDLQKSVSSTARTTNSPFFKPWITNVSSKTHPLPKDADYQSNDSNKYNLVQRTDDDGVTHIEVSKAVDEEYVSSLTTTDEYAGSSSIISISTPDVGNLFVSSAIVLPQNSYPLNEATALSTEIEGVICTDIDSSPVAVTKPYKDVGISVSVDDNKTTNNYKNPQPNPDSPPQRPQRGKYVKKNATKPFDSQPNNAKSKPVSGSNRPLSKTPTSDTTKQPAIQERVVRGQFIRVNVEQQGSQSSSPSVRTGPKIFCHESKPSGQMLSYPVWNLPTTRDLAKRAHRSAEDETDYRSSNRSKSCQRRGRSNSSDRRNTSSPARQSPVAYRYIDAVPQPKPLSNRFFGKLKEIANINNAYVCTLSRRRNSSGDLSTAQFYQYLEPALKTSPMSKSSTNLKSVIKKKNCNENMEPKKVTFSAYATVQVVD